MTREAPRSRRKSSRIVWLGLFLCLTAAGCGDSESDRETAEPNSPPQAAKHAIPRGLAEQPREPQGAKGRFRELKNFRGVERRNDYTPEQIAELERLSAIGYVSGSVPSAGFQNLTVFDEERAEIGLNFYLSGHGAEAPPSRTWAATFCIAGRSALPTSGRRSRR